MHRYQWPDVHLNYMAARMVDHGQRGLSIYIRLFTWARANIENPGCEYFSSSHIIFRVLMLLSSQGLSWLGRPFANYFMRFSKSTLTNPDTLGLILCSRVALTMWEGVKETQWSFLSPPWQLRDKGKVTNHRYIIAMLIIIPQN